MKSKYDKVNDFVVTLPTLEVITQMLLSEAGFDSTYVVAHSIDFSRMVPVFAAAAEQHMTEAFDKVIDSEELLEKVITMYKSEEFQAFEEGLYNMAKNCSIDIKTIMENPDIPKSAIEYSKKSNGILEQIEKIVKNHSDINPEHTEEDCANCDKLDCDERKKVFKKAILN